MESETRLGPYEIAEQLGAGGMGEVWLATDTRLGRQVAIKVLPEEYAGDPDRLARFSQEARAAAALNHPHIAVVHDVGHESGVHFIVQEFLGGRTLREALSGGRLPLARGLKLSLEIVEALGAAHKAGIVHRDLKPENVFVTEDGHAKVLDFGLAKLTEVFAPAVGGSASMSPTVLGTVAGQMMGTAGYMAPEQIEGTQVDHRADLFAFGCVLFEIACGQRAFQGKNLVDTLHRISNVEPDRLETIDGSLPAQLEQILGKALAKDPAARYQSAADLAVDLRRLIEAVQSGEAVPVALANASDAGGRFAPAVLAAVAAAALVTGAGGTWLLTRPEPVVPAVTHLEFPIASDDGFHGGDRRPLSISRDGRIVAFTDEGQIWLRNLGSTELTAVRGAALPRTPVFSPDGQWIAYGSQGQLLKIPVTGGAPVELTDESGLRGMTWTDSGTLLYGANDGSIRQVSENGGEPEILVEPRDGSERMQGPSLLPGGEWLVFARRDAGREDWSDSEVVARSLETREERTLVHGGFEPRYSATGHLTFIRDGNLLAVPFDVTRIEVTGGAVPLVEGISIAATGGAYYDLSERGDLVYFAGAQGGFALSLAWYDLEGNLEFLPFESTNMDEPRFSPDGNRLVVEHLTAGGGELWMYELDRRLTQRLTPAGVTADSAVWSPDGEWVYFMPDGRAQGLLRIRADLTGGVETASEEFHGWPSDISSDGTRLLYTLAGPESIDVWIMDLESGETVAVADGPANETSPAFSPDGRYVAYASNDTGYWRVYVRDLETDRPYVVSASGFGNALWSPDGTTLYFTSENALWSVPVSYEPEIRFGDAEQRFDIPERAGFPRSDITLSPDGTRFLIMSDDRPRLTAEAEGAAPDLIQVITAWSSLLRERVRPSE